MDICQAQGFSGDGFTGLALIYITFAIANWIAPAVVEWTGHKTSLLLGGCTYAVYVGQFLYPNDIFLYSTSCLLGVGAAIIWCAQGGFLTLNSTDANMTRNSGIFTAFVTTAKLAGNIFMYFNLKGKHEIDSKTRFNVSLVLFTVTSLGVTVFFCLKPTTLDKKAKKITESLKQSFKVFLTRDMLFLSVFNSFVGLQMSFRSSIYSTCLGFTHQFGADARALATVNGISVAVGTTMGAVLVAILAKGLLKKIGRNPVVILAFLVTIVGYIIVFLNIPHMATIRQTTEWDKAFLTPNRYLAILCGFLFGVADAFQATQLSSILGVGWRENSESAFALTKFTQCVASFLAFTFASHLSLSSHLAILTAFGIAGTVAFYVVEQGMVEGEGKEKEVCGGDDYEKEVLDP